MTAFWGADIAADTAATFHGAVHEAGTPEAAWPNGEAG